MRKGVIKNNHFIIFIVKVQVKKYVIKQKIV